MGFSTGYRRDKCGRDELWQGVLTKKDIQRLARQDDWTVGKQVLCPSCKTSKVKLNEVKT